MNFSYATASQKKLCCSNILISVDPSDVDFLQNLAVYFNCTTNCNIHLNITCPAFFRTKKYKTDVSEHLTNKLKDEGVHTDKYFGFDDSFEEFYNSLLQKQPEQVSDLALRRYDMNENWFSIYVSTVLTLIKLVYNDSSNPCKPQLFITVSFNETSPFSIETTKFTPLIYKEIIKANKDLFCSFASQVENIFIYENIDYLHIVQMEGKFLMDISFDEYLHYFCNGYETIVDISGGASFIHNNKWKEILSDYATVSLVGIMGGVFGGVAPFTSGPFEFLRRSSISTMNQTYSKDGFKKAMELFSSRKVPIVTLPNHSVFNDPNIINSMEHLNNQALNACMAEYYIETYESSHPKKPFDYIMAIAIIHMSQNIKELQKSQLFDFKFNTFGQTVIMNSIVDFSGFSRAERIIFDNAPFITFPTFVIFPMVHTIDNVKLHKDTTLSSNTPYTLLDSPNYEELYV